MAVTMKKKAPTQKFQNLKTKWLDFLMFTNPSERNNALLFEYYADEFAHRPRRFYNFIHLLYSYLKTSRTESTKKIVASRYIDVLSPLCQKFGFYEEKKILDSFAFKIIKPEKYKIINKNLISYKRKSKKLIEKINHKFEKLLKSHKFKVEISGRYKTTYSIYKKLKLKQRDEIQSLGDIFAFRIIVQKNSEEDCFKVLNLLHNTFNPLPERFKDYISIPKINGYQSLHTGLNEVASQLDLPVEVQIRTKAMEEFAEKGAAAHWLYSKAKLSRILTEKEKKLIQHFYASERSSKIYFFSYNGDLYKLEQGSSVLDFAYRIHTNFGNKLKAIFVNERPQEINYKIKEGDKIKIILSKKQEATREWLQYTQNKNTRKNILYATRNHK